MSFQESICLCTELQEPLLPRIGRIARQSVRSVQICAAVAACDTGNLTWDFDLKMEPFFLSLFLFWKVLMLKPADCFGKTEEREGRRERQNPSALEEEQRKEP